MGRTKGAVNKHKKEKQAKEQHHGIKQRGRPKGSIKQKQEQHQIVNVNINTRKSKSSDEDNEKKKKKKTLQNMIPNIIFNPSIAIPQGAPINRQETNPPFYDMNSLLQPERLSQLVKTPTPQIVQQIQPLTTNIATSQDKIKEEIKPTTEANVDNEQYTPNPQTDQSHPLIIPDLVMNSNVTTPMHNKHIQHKQIVQQVTPQVPKEVKPKYNDTEGLGHKIPIQRIGEIATAIGAGALTGGVTAAGEALLTGGLGALTAEGITGSAIGGGVGAGVYNALGNTGEIGHIVSGIAGAVAGRAAGRAASRRTTRPRPRTARTQENHPLLFRGDGNTTGGSRSGRSRLIEPEIQETHNPTTGESTTWVIPNREEQTIMNRIRRTANRTMRTAAETASNMSNQILDAGRTGIDNIRSQISDASENIIRRVRGRQPRALGHSPEPRLASRVPRSDEEGWNLYSRNDEIGRDINAASRIKAAIKRNKQKTLGHIRWDNEMAQNEQNREAANKLTAALKRTKQQINYEQDVMMHKEIKAKNDKMSKDILNDIVNSSVHHSDARQKAAATLQAALKRARPAPKLLKEHYKKLEKSDKATANFQNLTQHLGDVEQYGKQQDIVEGHRAKLKNIDNFEKLVTNKIKTANMVASKKDVIEGKAAEILQAMSRRRIEKGLTNKRMENAGDILGAVKRERAANRVKANAKTKLTYQFKDAKANHDVKKTGQPLVVLKGTEGPNPTLISQANHKRGLKAAETRKMNAEIEKEAQMLNEKYKNIMKKPSNYKGKNRFNPL